VTIGCEAERHQPSRLTPLYLLSIVELRSHGLEAISGDAVGPATFRGDKTFALQLGKEIETTIHQPMAVAIEAIDGDNPVVFTVMGNMAALGQYVQHPLLVSGNVHEEIFSAFA